ncbi:MAG TPA: ATP-binding protein [Dissulfurispiraceae bacterium]|nr:ATP-binding protein [Dissulfurispiraceae bacterium]
MTESDATDNISRGRFNRETRDDMIADIIHPAFKGCIDDNFERVELIPSPLVKFVEDVNRLFWQFDADKKMMQRAYELSSGKLIVANEYLRIAHEGLEQKVAERTAELLATNYELKNEIDERMKAEAALRQSEDGYRKLAEKLRELASELSLAEERERRRIAAELHDSIVQTLVFSKFKIETIMKDSGAADTDNAMIEIHEHIKKSVQDLRTLIFEISPPVLYDFGLEPAIETLTLEMSKRHGINLDFHSDDSEKKLNADLRVFLYHAVRELLINIVKHSQADSGAVTIARQRSMIVITVEDNGKGFDALDASSDIGKKECFGLFNIRERLGHFCGEMHINSEPGKGSRVTIYAPLEE